MAHYHCLELSGFTIISFILNQPMADLLSSNTFMSSFILFQAAYIVMSSAKFASLASLIKKIKSFIRILNKMVRNIEFCGVPGKKIRKTLSVSFIFTPCFLRFTYECTKVTASSENHMPEVLQQVNHEEYSQKSWSYP